MKNAYIIAGSNGSGKTTFAETFLPEYAKCVRFINADLIAAGLSPFSPQQVAVQCRLLADKWILFNDEGVIPEITAKEQNAHIYRGGFI